jgi:hypothetical protein
MFEDLHGPVSTGCAHVDTACADLCTRRLPDNTPDIARAIELLAARGNSPRAARRGDRREAETRQRDHAMLIKGGYLHSLKSLLEKARAEEQARAAGALRFSAIRLFRIDSFIGWMTQMWDRPRFS